MKYLVTGYRGQLGFDIVRELKSRKIEDIVAIDKEELDITDEVATMELFEKEKPDVVFHCAAWTAVDKAEECEDDVYKVNVEGTRSIMDASRKIGAKLFYISTDYVFDGTKEGEYVETDLANPMSVYGKTKFLGEQMVRKYKNSFIVRISWVFGINGNNFIKTMLKLSETKKELNVVDDQIGSPTYTVDLAKLLVDMSFTEKYGTYHANNAGFCSWAEFAKYIFESNHKDVKVNPVSTEEYLEITKTKQAYRPRNSKLSKTKLIENGFEMLPDWKDAVDRYCKELNQN